MYVLQLFYSCTCISIGFCEQSISSTDYIVTYDKTPSYTRSTATLRCIEGYASIEPGSAICGDDGEWIISYPECEGISYVPTLYVFNRGTIMPAIPKV